MAMNYLDARIGQDSLTRYFADGGFSDDEGISSNSLEVLPMAQPVYVADWVATALAGAMGSFWGQVAAREDKITLRPEDIPFPIGYAWLAQPVDAIREIWWVAAHNGVTLCYRLDDGCSIGVVPWRIQAHIWDFEWRGSADYIEEARRALLLAWALWSFMAQRIVTVPRYPLTRQCRKRVPHDVAERGVRVIELRQRTPSANGDGTGHGPSVRFSVRGHWRNQWYPSEERHKPVFVEAYIKGPEGAPLRLRSPIVSVSR